MAIYVDQDYRVSRITRVVLESMYRYLRDNSYHRDVEQLNQQIKAKIDSLRAGYNETPLHALYSDPETVAAYLMVYVASHCQITYEALAVAALHRPALRTWLQDKPIVRVNCIGGGPGTDLIGLAKWLREHTSIQAVRASNFDREEQWKPAWQCCCAALQTEWEVKLQSRFETTTWTQPISPVLMPADFTLCSYVAAEIYYEEGRETFAQNIRTLVDEAEAGACFVFVDNRPAKYWEWIGQMMKHKSIELIAKRDFLYGYQMPYKAKLDLEVFVNMFPDHRPHWCPKAAFRVYRKLG